MELFASDTIFGELPLEVQSTLAKITQTREIAKGEIVFHEGDSGVGLHFVQSGLVKIVKINEDGREHIIHILSKGDLFAEVLLFQDGNYPATAIGAEKSVIGIIANKELEKEICKSNDLALALIKSLSRRLQMAQQKIRSLALGDAKERIARTLLILLKTNGEEIENQGKVKIPYSRQDLAGLSGVTRETLARTLSEWQEEGIVSFQGKELVIFDISSFEKMLK